jgi:hypothetical protein
MLKSLKPCKNADIKSDRIQIHQAQETSPQTPILGVLIDLITTIVVLIAFILALALIVGVLLRQQHMEVDQEKDGDEEIDLRSSRRSNQHPRSPGRLGPRPGPHSCRPDPNHHHCHHHWTYQCTVLACSEPLEQPQVPSHLVGLVPTSYLGLQHGHDGYYCGCHYHYRC